MRSTFIEGLIFAVVFGASGAVGATEQLEESAPARWTRPVSLGVLSAWPWMPAHDSTVPLPALRLGVSVSPRVVVELTAGGIPYGAMGQFGLVDVGARWFMGDGNVSPYLMARSGGFFDNADEGSDRWYPYAVGGVGIDYSTAWGLMAWGEAGPGIMGYKDVGAREAALSVYMSLGVGYRF